MSQTSQIQPIDKPQLAVTPTTIRELLRRPLLALPPELRPEALLLWSTHKHLKGMESPLSLTAALAVWIERFGLRIDDAKRILGDMLAPASMAGASYTSDLMTTLAAAVDQQIKLRQKQAEQQRQREYEAARNANNLPPDELRAAMANNEFLSQFLTPDPEVTR